MRNICTSLFILLLISCCCLQTVFAQSSHSTWNKEQRFTTQIFTQQDGLPVISLTDIVQGADGYLYISSSGGVSRFNGSDFETISTQKYPQMNSNRIRFLETSPDSSIWMIDEQGFFSRWWRGQVFTYDSLYSSEVQSEWGIRTSQSGSVWINDLETFMLFDRVSKSFVEKLQLPDTKIYNSLPISDSLIFILTNEGLFEFSKEELSLRVPIDKIPFDPEVQSFFYLNTNLSQLSPFEITMADSGALGLYDIRSREYRLFPFSDELESTPPTVQKVNQTELLVSTLNGHFDLNTQTGRYEQFQGSKGEQMWGIEYDPLWKGKRLYISENAVHYGNQKIFEVESDERIAQSVQDKEGNLWLAVAGLGLVRLTPSPFTTLSSETGLQSDNTYSIIEDKKGDLWVSGFEFGIHRISDNNITWWTNHNSGLKNNLARSLYELRNGKILAGFWDSGLFEFDGDTWKELRLNDSLLLGQAESFFEETDGSFWIGSRGKLFHKETNNTFYSEVFTTLGNSVPRVQVITKDSRNRIWFGSHGSGLLIKNNRILKPVRFQELDPQPKIRDLYFQTPDTLWLATETNGLIRAILDESGNINSFHLLTEKDGLPDIGVHRILYDRFGFFWLPTNQGIVRIQLTSLNEYLDGNTQILWSETFKEDHGLPIREANGGTQSAGLVTSDHTIWVPTQKGIVIFDPADFLSRNPYKSTEINISGIQSEERTYELFGESGLKLQADERSLIIHFDLVHFSNPKDISIEYRFPGLGSSWNLLSKDRELSITNLPPGTHQLETRLANVPESLFPVTSFEIRIPPFFYERTWFYVLLFGIVSSIIAALFWDTKRDALKREKILNERVLERTKLLNQQKEETEKALNTVHKQAKELEKLSEARTNFFINMTHELRTPLTLIKGPLNLLQDASRKHNIDQEEQLALIDRNSTRLNNVVDQLLDLLRLDADPNPSVLRKIELVSCIRTHASQFLSSEDLIGKELSIPEDSQKYYIIANPDACSLIVNNLISNAIKYTNEKDKIELNISETQDSIVLEVKDTGIGISERDMEFIFDPFYRSELAAEKQGSGIGLSIVKNFIERMGGKVEISSQLGSGTQISIFFPKPTSEALDTYSLYKKESKTLSEEHVGSKDISIVPDQSEAKPDIRNKPTILLVEDNKDLQVFIRRLLEQDYSIRIANNGTEALSVLHETNPELIITDLMMPGMDGISFIRELRTLKAYTLTPVIILSAKKSEQSVTEGLLSGAQVYLSKPIDNKILLAQIESLLEREKRIKDLDKADLKKEETPELMIQIEEIVLRHISDPDLSVASIASTLHMSRPTLYRKWNEIADVSINDYITQTRLTEAISLIRKKKYSFAETSIICGFSEPSYFSRVFKKHYGVTPSQYFENENPQT